MGPRARPSVRFASLGYGGLLERIRFAVDPAINSFFFGTVTER